MKTELNKNNIILKTLIDMKKHEAFVEGYEATDAEALGLLISQYFSWDGLTILETTSYALEDANFHNINKETIAPLIARLKN